MYKCKFDLPFGYDIINNNETKKDDLEGSYGIYDKNVREETKEDISSGVVTPSIMHFKICKEKS